MSGLPDIDVDDWQSNTEYSSGYSEDTPVIKVNQHEPPTSPSFLTHLSLQWFWEVVRGFEKKDLAILLQFVTGSSRVPLGGFASLVGATGLTKFTVSRLEYTYNRLPLASTW